MIMIIFVNFQEEKTRDVVIARLLLSFFYFFFP